MSKQSIVPMPRDDCPSPSEGQGRSRAVSVEDHMTAGISWLEADELARQRLKEDYLAIKVEGESVLDKYFAGINFVDKFVFVTCALRCTSGMRLLKHVSELAWIVCQWEMGRVLGFGPAGRAACAWVAFNCYLKTFFQSFESYEKSMHNPENALYTVMRMLPESKMREFQQDLSFFGGLYGVTPGHMGTFLVMICMITMASLSVAGLVFSGKKTEWDCAVIVLDVIFWIAWPFHTFWQTPLFWVVGKQFASCIREFRITDMNSKNQVDIRKCFQNYIIMNSTIAKYTEHFVTYFFVVEFTLILWVAFLAAALYEETEGYLLDPTRSNSEEVLICIRLALLATFFVVDIVILCFIFMAAASITEAADKREVSHTVMWHTSANENPSVYLEHVYRTSLSIGFTAMGITINYSLMLQSMYFVTSVIAFYINYTVFG